MIRPLARKNSHVGKVDDFGIWNISPEEIEALYSLSSPIEGCTDASACNYNEEAQWEDGSCHFNCQFCHVGTVWDEVFSDMANPADMSSTAASNSTTSSNRGAEESRGRR